MVSVCLDYGGNVSGGNCGGGSYDIFTPVNDSI